MMAWTGCDQNQRSSDPVNLNSAVVNRHKGTQRPQRAALTLPSPARRERVAEGRVRVLIFVLFAFFCGYFKCSFWGQSQVRANQTNFEFFG